MASPYLSALHVYFDSYIGSGKVGWMEITKAGMGSPLLILWF